MTATADSFVDRPSGSSEQVPVGERSAPFSEARAAFAAYETRVRARVEATLDAWLTAKASVAAGLPPPARAPAEAAWDLARRGGKRWRAVLVGCAYEAFDGDGGADAVVLAGVALELLQVYLLIHDDWMDGDEQRRGGPSVPAMMRARYGPGELADASAILAGDYAAGLALDALLAVPCSGERLVRAARELARVQEEVVLGQLLDVHPISPEPAAGAGALVERTYRMKTASYTVRGPVLIGARLAGASDDQCSALEAYAAPLGVAFQLRDDVLGTFGDPRSTGKPRLSDLRRGKRTALVAEVSREPGARHRLRALGDPAARQEDLEAIAAWIDACGARARVEARIDVLLAEARGALSAPSLAGAHSLALRGAIGALGNRET